jgi:hypothetical protein
VARRDRARQAGDGTNRLDGARRGEAGGTVTTGKGMTGSGEARQARFDRSRHGSVGHGLTGQDMAGSGQARRGLDGSVALLGGAWRGVVGLGRLVKGGSRHGWSLSVLTVAWRGRRGGIR